jgi:hypothetical protein
MKYVIRGAIYNLLCILVFFLLYLSFKNQFTLDPSLNKNKPPKIPDLLFLSTTVQAGVGYSIVYPLTFTSKMIMIFQQFFMIISNLMLFYLFTL